MAPLTRLHSHHDIDHLIGILEHIPKGGTCIEGGAHRGIWTRTLQTHFDSVVAFEPHPDHFEELVRGVDTRKVNCYCLALGDSNGYWRLAKQPGAQNDGQFRLEDVSEPGECVDDSVFCVRIDDGTWPDGVRFIKLDVEGAELMAVRGAAQTITRYRPFVMIEQNALSRSNFDEPIYAAANYLRGLGMVEIGQWNKDHLYGWPK